MKKASLIISLVFFSLSTFGKGLTDTLIVNKLSPNHLLMAFDGKNAEFAYKFLNVSPVKSEEDEMMILTKNTPTMTCYYYETKTNEVGHECWVQMDAEGKNISSQRSSSDR